MSHVKNPAHKKRLSYARDHIALAEYPHALRRQWPKKEACIERAYRHEVREQLAAPDAPEAQPGVEAVRRKRARKWGANPLGTQVENRLRRRDERLGWNFFKGPYKSALRERTCRFFESLLAERSHAAASLAGRLREAFAAAPFHLASGRIFPLPPGVLHAWLLGFFADEPSWEPRLRAWADSAPGGG